MNIRTRIETLALGVGRMFDFSGRLNFQRRYYLSVASDKIDYDALASDWDVVGGGRFALRCEVTSRENEV